MKLSTRGRYGVRLMLDLALHYGEGPIFLKDIAERQGISEKYLWQLINPLKTTGLINSQRGAHGGYVLGKAPERISLKEILQILEGSLCLVDCVDNPSFCERSPLLYLPGHLGGGVEEACSRRWRTRHWPQWCNDRRRRDKMKQDNNLINIMMCMCYYTGRGGLFM